MSYLVKFVLVFVVVFFYCSTLIVNRKVEEFAKVFVNVVSIVASISLFFWLFGSVFDLIKGAPTPYIWAGRHTTVNYFWLYFENRIQATELFGQSVIRNTGIYAEAPGFSSYLIVALAIALPAERKKFPLKQKVLLIITMMTTLSTKGLIAVLILITLTYLVERPAKSASKFFQKVIIATVIMTVATIGIILLLEDKSTTTSYLIRIDDVRAAISVWKKHVLFGSGYWATDEIIKNFSVSRSNNGLSMGLTLLLAQGGIYMVLFYVASFIVALRAARRMDHTLFTKVLIFGTMIVFNLIISSSQYTLITIFIIACGYAFSCSVHLKQNSKMTVVLT